ncbi:26762_t:CDS:2 [Dentiscutata erythropus]|uniref:26762_t:CDS:1 n=1 Tax=Dentiscutata erythropus TaxID=1348616 RepID=A0A9N9EUY5_9GLOM|nr:26762_t:CDS:2 [Dentiscutata erythropus]
MNYEVREDVSTMLTAISPIQPTPIALPVEQDGSGHRETIIPLSPTTPQEDSAGFSGTAGGLSDNGTFVTPQAASPSVILAVEKKRVERDEMGMVRKRTYDCEHGGRYTPKKKAAVHEQRNRTSKRIECGWHINLSFPKTSTCITVTTFVNEHNHELNIQQTREARPSAQPSTTQAISSPRYRSVLEAASPKNRNLPKAVLDDIEFYTLHGNLGVTTQRQLLKAKYPNHQLPARDIASAVQKFKGGTDLKGLDNDAAKLWIWELARRATQIAVDQQDNSLEELLRRYIRDKEDRIGRQTSQTTQQ